MTAKLFKYGSRYQKYFFFQQDNAPAHSSDSTRKWFKQKNIKLYYHPPNSPDLNPIEHIWGIMKNRLRKQNIRFSSQDELKNKLTSLWSEIDLNLIN